MGDGHVYSFKFDFIAIGIGTSQLSALYYPIQASNVFLHKVHAYSHIFMIYIPVIRKTTIIYSTLSILKLQRCLVNFQFYFLYNTKIPL